MEFQVLAITVDVSETPCRFGETRSETIDTRNPDSPFAGCSTIQEVEFAYERYWNYRNDPDVLHDPARKIKVLTVTPVFAA